MKKVISMFAVLMMIAALCVGCNEADSTTSETTEQQQEKKVEENNAKDWEPEIKEEPAPPAAGGHDPNVGDHTGHNH